MWHPQDKNLKADDGHYQEGEQIDNRLESQNSDNVSHVHRFENCNDVT